MPYIEKCRNLWYATLKVPEVVRPIIGKTKFKQSLGTCQRRFKTDPLSGDRVGVNLTHPRSHCFSSSA